MLITKLFSDYPDFFSFGDMATTNEVDLNFAGFAKDEIKASVKGRELIVIAESGDHKKIRKVYLDRNVTEDDLVLQYKHGLLNVKVKPKKEKQKQLLIE